MALALAILAGAQSGCAQLVVGAVLASGTFGQGSSHDPGATPAAPRDDVPPSFAVIADQTMAEDGELLVVIQGFTAGTASSQATSLEVTCSDPLVPPGNITVTGEGSSRSLRLRPAANASGTATIHVVARAGAATFARTFTLVVTPVNDAPVALAGRASTDEDVAVGVTLTGFDVDGDVLTYVVAEPPARGQLAGAPPSLILTPMADFAGTDGLRFTVSDGIVESAPATVTIEVRAINDAPVAGPQHALVPRDTPSAITLSGTDVDGDPLTFIVTAPPAHGSLSGSPPQLTYSPDASYLGADELSFEVQDPSGASSAPARVTIHVHDLPTISSISPERGPLDGGTAMTVTGALFAGDATVTVGGLACSNVVVVSPSRIDCLTPAGALGFADVAVTNVADQASVTSRASFFYEGFEPFSVEIVRVPGGNTDQDAPAVVIAPGGTIYCAWSDQRSGNHDIHVAGSVDGGTSWSPSVRVDDDTTGAHQFSPTLTLTPSGALVCAWVDKGRFGSVTETVFAARSDDGGATWSANVRVDDRGSNAKSDPTIAAEPGGEVVCAWSDDRPFGNDGTKKLYFSRSVDGGATWATNQRISSPDATSHVEPCLAVDPAGVIVCVWTARGYREILAARSDDHGATWTIRRVDDGASENRQQPSVVAHPSGALVSAWHDDRGAFRGSFLCSRSDDGGLTWSPNVPVHVPPGNGVTRLALAVDAVGTLLCAWEDRRNGNSIDPPDLYAARSVDVGATWQEIGRIDDDPGLTRTTQPALAASGAGTFACVWTDARRGNDDIRCARTTNAGTSWGSSARVDDDEVDHRQQDQAVVEFRPSGEILLAWRDTRGWGTDIYCAHSTDGGATWSANVRVNDDDGLSGLGQGRPALLSEPGGAILCGFVGHDPTDPNGGANVTLRRTLDGGQTWGDVSRPNDGGPRVTSGPTLARDQSGGLICAWLDYRAGGEEIYFARSADGGATWTPNVRVCPPGARCYTPRLSVTATGILCSWAGAPSYSGPTHIFVSRSVDGGATWQSVRVDGDVGTANRFEAGLASTSSGMLVCVWQQPQEGIFVSRSVDGGLSWSASSVLEAVGNNPRIVVEPGGAIMCAWSASDTYYTASIHWTRSRDDGATWSPISRLWDAGSRSTYPSTGLMDLGVGPGGQLGLVGSNSDWREDVVFVRGWFRP